MKKRNGFTLVELMIVIAIVSVLAAIAIPSYLSYIRKSQLTEGIIVTSGLRNDIASHIWEYKQFPNAAMVAPTGSIGKQANALNGKYVAKDSIAVAADTGIITVSFDAGSISGETLILKPRVNTLGNRQIIEWTCSGTVSTYILPNSCKN